LLEKPRQIGA